MAFAHWMNARWLANSRKLGTAYFVLLLIAGFMGAASFFSAYRLNAYQETQAAIELDLDGFVQIYTFAGIEGVTQTLKTRLAMAQVSSFYLLVSQDETYLMGNIGAWPQQYTRIEAAFREFEVAYGQTIGSAPVPQDPGLIFPHFDVLAQVHTFDSGHKLLIGRNIDGYQNSRVSVLVFALVSVVVLFIMALVSSVLSTVTLARVRLIHQTARQVIETGDLSSRIPADQIYGDFKSLADTLNAMLERIETLVAGVRQVSDNIAHDLRTPLTRLKHDIESYKSGESSVDIDDVAQEVDRIITTFNALLRIANIEQGVRYANFAPVNLSKVLDDLSEYYSLVAEEKNMTVTVAQTGAVPEIMGDKDLLFQALSNVIENSIKYTPRNGTIALTVAADLDHVRILIADTGPGIADVEKSKVFGRFYRVDQSRNLPGNGLGLALVKVVMDMHHATICLQDQQPTGLCVTIAFPIKP